MRDLVKYELNSLFQLYINSKYDIGNRNCLLLARFILRKISNDIINNYLPGFTNFDDPFIADIVNNIINKDYIICKHISKYSKLPQ